MLLKDPTLKAALKLTAPVITAYLFLGIAFGVLFCAVVSKSWFLPPMMALLVYAGSAQFIATGLLAAHVPLWEIALVTFLINGRHLFFSLSMIESYQAIKTFRWFAVLTLADETYTLLSSYPPPEEVDKGRYYLLVSLIDYSAWVLGCLLGGILGANLGIELHGIEFLLTALFCVASIEQFYKIPQKGPFLAAIAIAFIALFVFGKSNMLLGSMVLATSLLMLTGRRLKV